jgi:6-phosphogluconate dehydrogenase
MKSEIGILGLGVMGKSLARNFVSHGISTSVFNMPLPGEENVTQNFVASHSKAGLYGARDLTDFIASLQSPRVVLLMIKSGEAVDQVIEKIVPLLDEKDIIIDAGNSFFKDTQRRFRYLQSKSIELVGMGVSGGEQGALLGPSIMPAGSNAAQYRVLPMLKKIAAKVEGEPCVAWMGSDGAGHFAKMVHNGIEYAEMQLIAEAYDICRTALGLSNLQIADIFADWNKGIHESFLIEISIDILQRKEGDAFILDTILDMADHKGTGMWTAHEALELGVAVPGITAALNQRIVSAYITDRQALSKNTSHLNPRLSTDIILASLEKAILAGRLIVLAEGFHLLMIAAKNYAWDMQLSMLARVWRGGCIIRSAMLPMVMRALSQSTPTHLFHAPEVADMLIKSMPAMNQLLSEMQKTSIGVPCLAATNQYYKAFTSDQLGINLIQAQRDYFGAHTYRTIDEPTVTKHTQWKAN